MQDLKTMHGDLNMLSATRLRTSGLHDEGAGLLPRVLHEIFASHARSQVQARYRVSYCEVLARGSFMESGLLLR